MSFLDRLARRFRLTFFQAFVHRQRPPALVVAVALLSLAQVEVSGQQAEAIPGRPFGVGTVTVPLKDADWTVAQLDAYSVSDEQGRVYYPAFSAGLFRGLIDEVIGDQKQRVARNLTVYFLFRGDEPLRVTVRTSREVTVDVIPRAARRINERRLWQRWWRSYYEAAQRQSDAGDYPPLVETYLTSMLGRRLGFDPPLLARRSETPPSEFRQTLEMLFGMEAYRLSVMRRTSLGEDPFQAPLVAALPAPPVWRERAFALPGQPPTIEGIAEHVPRECFYIRFGTWNNQLWLTRLLNENGGDLSRMINLRGQDAKSTQKMLTQLVLEQSAISELLGGQLISDVAVIGRDTFMTEGSASAVIFEARNALLGSALNQQRRAAFRTLEPEGATLETIEIAGHDVSFLSTPDNRIRSFFVNDGNYYITSNSREIVRRFFEAGAGKDALGKSSEFQHARSVMPIERDDTIFVYFSTAFLQGLISPQYQIELDRRTKSATDLEILQLAQLAARGENVPGDSIAQLIAADLLPEGFGMRHDGSGPIIETERVIDSRRGARGYFTPVPDVVIVGVTQSELDFYQRRIAYYQENWQQFDPLMIGLKRMPVDDQFERLVVDARVAPFGEEKYGWIFSLLGDPLAEQMTLAPEDIIHVQASVKGGLLLPSIPPHVLFAAVQDDGPPQTNLEPSGFFDVIRILRTTPGYLGAWPKPGFLDLIPIGLGAEPDANGFTSSILGIWRWQGNDYSLLAFDRQRLAAIAPTLGRVAATDPAQIRVRVGDLSRSTLRDWANTLAYARARQTSIGNSRMLHSMTQQLKVPPSETLKAAEQILNVDLVCALGGEYELKPVGAQPQYWLSNQLGDPTSTQVPVGFSSPFMQWFRGLDAALDKAEGQMRLHLELDREIKKPVENQ